MVENSDKVEENETHEVPRSNECLFTFEIALLTWGERRQPHKLGANAKNALGVTKGQIHVGEPWDWFAAENRKHRSEVVVGHICGKLCRKCASGTCYPLYF